MRHSFVDLVTQLWVRVTGRTVELEQHPWLEGPVGDTDVIGERFFHRWAERQGFTLDGESAVRGLLPDLRCLDGPRFESAQLNDQVASFYRETSRYSFDVTPEWKGGLRLFARLVARLFSKRLRQLNVPLSAAEVSGGASSEVFSVQQGERHLFTAWIRTLRTTGNTLYAGAYSTATIPGHANPCIKVVFPLPNGSAIVIMRPDMQEDGSLVLRSEGKRFGDPGFYFYVRKDPAGGVARYVRALQETIHVYPGEGRQVLAEHTLSFWGHRFLSQKYRM